ncbi:hypothetical protein ACSU1N_05740 [Thermogladius sp. 4427co]|uniref:hypothetical protein n=1 Tax=Thermogladius sp. 4427co TaxID=3450718 RepID=UPI003F79D418
MPHKIVLAVLASRLGYDVGVRISRHVEDVLREKGLRVDYIGVVTDKNQFIEARNCRIGVFIVATGGTEELIVEAGRRCDNTVLFYYDGYNSLPASLEAAAFLRDISRRVELRRFREVPEIIDYASRVSRVLDGVERFRSCRYGVIGGPSSWLVYSRVNASYVREKLGIELVDIPMEELIEEFSKASPHEVLDFSSRAVSVDVSAEDLNKALKLHSALENLIRKYNLCGLTVRCFDLITTIRTTACLSMALLNTRLVPSACEGDVPLLISMALGEFIAHQPVFMGNPVVVTERQLLLAHCTSPLVSRFRLTTHFESGIGVGVSVEYPEDSPATVFRVDPKLLVLRIGLGRVRKWNWRSDMCRTQVLLELEGAYKIVEESIGNHYALVLGDWLEDLRIAGELLGLRIDYINKY